MHRTHDFWRLCNRRQVNEQKCRCKCLPHETPHKPSPCPFSRERSEQSSSKSLVLVNNNVTHRVCTHRLCVLNMEVDAPRHPNPLWACNPPNPRGTGDQSGGGCGTLWVAPHVLQRHRTRCQKCFAGQYREDW